MTERGKTSSGRKRIEELLRTKSGFIFDLDGTIYLGERIIEGADRTIAMLRAQGKKLAFLSNKPLESRETYAQKLNRLGIPCQVDEVINSSLVCARYVRKHFPAARVFPIGEPPLVRELQEHGLRISEDPETIDVVVIAFDRTFDYRKLNIAYNAAVRGAELIATNPDRTCPMPGYRLPDCACMIAAIEACSERKVETIVGKPSPIMLAEVMEILGLEPSRCVMFGDRPETDMVMAKRAGLCAVLVLTGVTGARDLESLCVKPDLVLESVAELLPQGAQECDH